MPDRPSREYRLVHEADTGLPLLEPVTDPPEAPDRSEPAKPPGSPPEPSAPRHWLTVLLPALAVVLGPGGAVAVVLSSGSDTARSVDQLRDEVRLEREDTRRRLDALTSEVSELRMRSAAEDAARRARDDLVDSYLRQRPRPDVTRAREALAE